MSLLKFGELTYYSRGFFGSKWKEGFFQLFDNSTIKWFENKNDLNPEGVIYLRSVVAFLAVGPYTRSVPGKPVLPPNAPDNLLLCFPRDASRKASEICWILFKDIDQLNDWMHCIFSTCPSPPPQHQIPQYQEPPPQYSNTSYPTQAGVYQTNTIHPPPPPNAPIYQAPYPTQPTYPGQPTTIVYNMGPLPGQNNNSDDLALGMLAGAALGYGLGWGRPWGMHHRHRHCWGPGNWRRW